MIRKTHLLTLALALSAGAAFAQPPAGKGGPPPPPPGQGGPQGGQQGEHRPPASPLVAALDTDGDGIISASEIDNAPESLKKLDKNHDGKLTMDELRPPRPDGKGPGGPGGQGGGAPRKGPGDGKGPKGPDQDAPPAGKPADAPDGPSKGGPQDGQKGGKRPAPPLIAALDTDGDGVISADEIANASASLRKLDKNGDGQLTPDEYRPAPPKRDGQKGDGPKPPPKDGDAK